MTGKERSSMLSYSVRRYKEGDEGEINDLFNQVFNQNRDLDQWNWKFWDSRELLAVAETEGEIISHCASAYMFFKLGDKVIKLAQVFDIMIRPNTQKSLGRHGVWAHTYELALKIWDEKNIPLAIGFPNKRAYALPVKYYKWKVLDPIPLLRRRLNWRFTIKKRLQWLPLSLLAPVRLVSNIYYKTIFTLCLLNKRRKIKIRMVSSFDDRINSFWERVKENYGIIGIRDKKYLNWRYVDKPNDHYDIMIAEENDEIIGYIILKIEEHSKELIGYIVDLLSIENSNISKLLIVKALQYFLSKKVDYASCMMVRKDSLYQVLLMNGFKEEDAIHFVYLLMNSDKIDESFLKASENWHVTFGDTDGV